VCISATSGAIVKVNVLGIVNDPIHQLVSYGGAGWGPNAQDNTLCGSLADFTDPNKPNFGCPQSTDIPISAALTYRVIYDSPFSSQPQGFTMGLFPPYPAIPVIRSSSQLVVKSPSDYTSTTSLPPPGECWTGPTDNYTAYYQSVTGSLPSTTVTQITDSPPGNTIAIDYFAANIAPTITRRVDLLCTLTTTDRIVSSSEIPLASQWNYYSNSATSGCENKTSYAVATEITPVGDIKVVKYIIDVTSTTSAPSTGIRYASNSPSICSSFVENCGGVATYTSPSTMRVNPSQLVRLPAGPNSVTGATTAFTQSYGLLVYNQAAANAYDIELVDIVGEPSSSAVLPPLSISNFQANYASTGVPVPGTFTLVNNVVRFKLDPGVPLSGTATGAYDPNSAIFITFDTAFDAKGPNCQVRNRGNVSNYAAIPGGINQGEHWDL